MRLFISWSGELSNKYAKALESWLPNVLQQVHPFLSSSNIDSGARWGIEIAKELEKTTYGILVLTKQSMPAPWLNFEAGALSKSMENSRVVPLLFGLKKADVKYPLAQFQARIFEEEEMKTLIADMNSACEESIRIDPQRLETIFKVWWPELEKSILSVEPHDELPDHKGDSSSDPSMKVLEEILETVRSQQRMLSPDALAPHMLHKIMRDVMRETMRDFPFGASGISVQAIQDAVDSLLVFLESAQANSDRSCISLEGLQNIKHIAAATQHMSHRVNGSREKLDRIRFAIDALEKTLKDEEIPF